LVKEGLYDLYIENDDFWRYVSGLEKPWRKDENPDIEKHRKVKNDACAFVIGCLSRRYDTCVSGLWPHESKVFMEKLQNWRAIVIKPPNREEARERWIQRGQTGEEFDYIFPRDNYSRLERQFEAMAVKLDEKDRLIPPDAPEATLVWRESVILPLRRGTGLENTKSAENRNGDRATTEMDIGDHFHQPDGPAICCYDCARKRGVTRDEFMHARRLSDLVKHKEKGSMHATWPKKLGEFKPCAHSVMEVKA
jgi:hypothetical protein